MAVPNAFLLVNKSTEHTVQSNKGCTGPQERSPPGMTRLSGKIFITMAAALGRIDLVSFLHVKTCVLWMELPA